MPANAQLLRAHPVTAKTGQSLAELAWGIPHDEDQFLAKAVEAGHPKLLPALLPAALEESVKVNASTSLQDLAAIRLDWFRRWSSRAQELSHQEKGRVGEPVRSENTAYTDMEPATSALQ